MKSTEALHTHATAHSCCGDHHCTPTQPGNAPPAAQATQGTVFRIAAMDCAAEESEIRRALASIPGIRGLGFQLGARTLSVQAPEDAQAAIATALAKAGFAATRLHSDSPTPQAAGQGWRMGAALGLALAAEGLHFAFEGISPWRYLGMALALVAIACTRFFVPGLA